MNIWLFIHIIRLSSLIRHVRVFWFIVFDVLIKVMLAKLDSVLYDAFGAFTVLIDSQIDNTASVLRVNPYLLIFIYGEWVRFATLMHKYPILQIQALTLFFRGHCGWVVTNSWYKARVFWNSFWNLTHIIFPITSF